MTAGVAAAFAVAGTAALGWFYRRDHRRAQARRHGFFDDCRGLLDQAELAQDAIDYPSLSGYYQGHSVELRALADTIQLRKLPVLWLLVTIHRPIAVHGMLDVMIRPDNTEYYSHHNNLRDWHATPPDWPQEAVIRTDDRATTASLIPPLTPYVARFTSGQRGKEIFLSPKGIRLVYRLDESQRGHYLLIRQPLFDCATLERGIAQELLQLGFDIAHSLDTAQ